MDFINSAAFKDPNSRLSAMGTNLKPHSAITDAQGNVLTRTMTGGIISPTQHELHPSQKIFRFGGGGRSWEQVAAGCWWLAQAEFEKVLAFSNSHGLTIGTGMRYLCLVPPEWSDVTVLIRARVMRGLLAWRGLGNTVVTPVKSGGVVHMPHQNEIASRRCYQLYIPGLGEPSIAASALAVENCYHLDPHESKRGFLYL